MIKGIITVAFSLAVNVSASAQLFQVPSRVTFSNLNVNLEPGARDIVQTDVYALLANRTTINTRLDRAVLYFPIIENILSEENVPNDFKYLVLQESGLAADAVSTSNAVGFWQFKKETATDYGLRVDDEIDERKNIHAATRAAARYLKKTTQRLTTGFRRSTPIIWAWVAFVPWYLLLGMEPGKLRSTKKRTGTFSVAWLISWFTKTNYAGTVRPKRLFTNTKPAVVKALRKSPTNWG
ncbi:hypothetical protein BWI93_01555 [Siphonobacter sp. BAB-5385]|uniref:transglycosylase SLT domain-containing protein n=1 Tax=Siphonobacter sp. BAB-5385 TaxID=1864822 RepID=UPI000B9EB3AF|nr:transglycosylase SLT domain-containing protein [Siphonobacter sp. BAB-5385]OZI09863.1 hypothetical protein BWI93_01555 [Siphonobacter sp. BAB-5385]